MPQRPHPGPTGSLTPATAVTERDRRRHRRHPPEQSISVRRAVPIMPISDAQVLNVSMGGVAIKTRVPMRPGERLSFSTDLHAPPILAEVLACEPLDDAEPCFRVRCRCLLGGFAPQW